MLAHTTKYLLVSRARPGPMKDSHHPGVGSRSLLRACDDADKPVWRTIVLVLSALSSPHVSYASLNPFRTPACKTRTSVASLLREHHYCTSIGSVRSPRVDVAITNPNPSHMGSTHLHGENPSSRTESRVHIRILRARLRYARILLLVSRQLLKSAVCHWPMPSPPLGPRQFLA